MIELKAPEYPKDYFHFGGGARISEGQINDWLKEAFDRLRDEMLANPDQRKGFTCIASGDTKVFVTFFKDRNMGDYQVSFDVCRSYANGDIFNFDPKISIGFIPVK